MLGLHPIASVSIGGVWLTVEAPPALFSQAQLDYLLAYMEANMAFPTAADIAAAILAAAQITPIASNIASVNSVPVAGAGTAGAPWGAA